MPGNTGYCLAKGGMRMLTSTAGVELTRHNILVVGVGPGAVATPINLGTMNDQAKLAQFAAIRVGRRAPRIASVVGFLAGDGASYITATTVFADGGSCKPTSASSIAAPPVASACDRKEPLNRGLRY
jgi:glucose 1-dehydrogenase